MANEDVREWVEVPQSGQADGVAEMVRDDDLSRGDRSGGVDDHKSDLPGDGNQPAVSNPKFPPPTKSTR